MKCGTCKRDFYVPLSEWNRKLKKGEPRCYCSRSCAGKKGREDEQITATCLKCGNEFLRLNKGFVKKYCSRQCSNSKVRTDETKEKIRISCRRAYQENPEMCLKGLRAALLAKHSRFSSKAERALGEALSSRGFTRHKQIKTDALTFDVDIVSDDSRVWIESDGEWHFRQVHAGHDFVKTQLRDQTQETEALARDILLIRVNNQTTSVEQQVAFVIECMTVWDGKGCVKRLGFEETFNAESP